MISLKQLLLIAVTLVLVSVSTLHAEVTAPAYSPEQLGAIREAQIRVSENRDALTKGDLSRDAAEARVARILIQLNADLPTSLTEKSLIELNIQNVMPRMVVAERTQSFFAGINFLRLGLIAVFSILFLLLIGKHLLKVLIEIPKEFWVFLVYGIGIGILLLQAGGQMAVNQFWAFFGCIMIGGGLGLFVVIRTDYYDEHPRSLELYAQYVCPTVMLIAFVAATLITGSQWMGAFAALSLMALLGFAAQVVPFGYVVGFRGNDELARATSSGFLVLILFMALHAANITNSAIRVFEPGSLIVSGFVGYLGLLIAASKQYRNRQRWIVMQAIVLVACFLGVIAGSLLGLKSIQIIAGVFLTLWTIEKLVEIPGEGFVPWVLKLMAVSGILYLIVTYGAPLYARYLIQ
jgi:hypothetical protein